MSGTRETKAEALGQTQYNLQKHELVPVRIHPLATHNFGEVLLIVFSSSCHINCIFWHCLAIKNTKDMIFYVT